MRVPELKALARDHGLRNYSLLRRAELAALLQNNSPPPPQMSTWEPIDDWLRPYRPAGEAPLGSPWRLRQPLRSMGSVTSSPQEMNIFEEQEMSKSRPQVKNKLNDWYNWLINHVPKPIKDGASRAFKTFKDKIMGLYNRVTGSNQPGTSNQAQLKGSRRPLGPSTQSHKTKPFNLIELEQAFSGVEDSR